MAGSRTPVSDGQHSNQPGATTVRISLASAFARSLLIPNEFKSDQLYGRRSRTRKTRLDELIQSAPDSGNESNYTSGLDSITSSNYQFQTRKGRRFATDCQGLMPLDIMG
jgi:hypothetical protein